MASEKVGNDKGLRMILEEITHEIPVGELVIFKLKNGGVIACKKEDEEKIWERWRDFI